MFCNNCGKEISDEAVICVHCGVATGRPMPGAQVNPVPAAATLNDPNEPANVGLVVLSVLVPLAGIVMGAIHLSDGRKRAGKAYLTAALITIGASILLTVLFYVIFFIIVMNA